MGIAKFMKQFVYFYNKNYMTSDRILKLAGFFKLIFSNEGDRIWKESMRGLRYLAEMTGELD